MRLRNIPRADSIIDAHPAAVREETSFKGRWKEVFENENPLCVEIGMGKGQFLLTLAKQNPNVNYVGIERYSSVLLRAIERYGTESFEGINNIRFVCMDAANIADVFGREEVSKIYLSFSDPWPKARHAQRRLTSTRFLARYEQILAQNGDLEFKTDNNDLFEFSLGQVKEAGWKLISHTYDLHKDRMMNQGNVMTEYEARFSAQGNPIYKLIAMRQQDKSNCIS